MPYRADTPSDSSPPSNGAYRFIESLLGLYAGVVPLSILLSLLANGWLPPVTAVDQVRSVLLLAGLPSLALAMLLGRRRLAASLLMSVALFAWFDARRLIPRRPNVAEADFSVVTWSLEGLAPDAIDAAIERLVDTDADVVLLQGVSEGVRLGLTRTTAVARRFPHCDVHESAQKAILSRFPLESSATVPLSSPSPHLRSVVRFGEERVSLLNVRIGSFTPWLGNFAPSSGDFAQLNDLASGSAPAIIGGDFRTSDHSSAHRQLKREGWTDAIVAVGEATLGLTYSPSIGGVRLPPMVPFDTMLTNNGLTPVTATLLDWDDSDHRPVYASFRVNQETVTLRRGAHR